MIRVHFGVSMRIIWDTIQNDLEPFAIELRRILAESDTAGSGESASG